VRKNPRQIEKNVEFSGMHLQIEENYFETGVPLEENKK
jgi:hypothetical protein